MTVALTSIKISTDFDSGNIQVLDASDAYNLLLAIQPDTRSHHYQWFHFKAEGMHVGHTHNFRLSNAGGSSYKHAWSGYNAVASYDHVNWFRVPTRFDGEILHISLETSEKHAWLAYFEPYSRERHDWLIDQALKYAGTQLLATGKSVEGRDIQLLRRGKGGEGRRNIWIIAQQHPGEHMAEWFMEGIIERLQQDGDAEMKKLLAVADLYLVPNMNPDGAFHGHLRTNAMGQDLNRAWQSASQEISPEVLFVQQQMHQYGVDLFLDIHGDEEIPYVFTAACEGNPSYTPRIEALEKRFRSHLSSLTRDFQTTHGYTRDLPGEANMTLACNAVGEQYDCLSLTLEMPFKDNDNAPNPQTGWSGERSKQLAKNVLSSVADIVTVLR
ncbi:murein tripeptide amidase MpaA [Pseudomonas sp. SJZ103]|uniref:M14 family metallopeptidase n=1 Tax=unclassified Pseudomonas TaxID=196821 RepID=UPI00103DA81C|nr:MULTISPECIES: M14-type cytosolic carboxypeptidase [unclassified Pseudomonas]MBB6286622.1 murein tripeptide amidase MpaA [Pseudomonas sp. SJZ073]MBB6311453.1 murein tripeptide amidase MpaA [Pseudomonas sp. JAI120]TWC65660.1 murein tripeptide amidase MpaA [Pseudomonas sp. SJZ103]TWC82178.1 murein tripeptide amidase MpaA [Pseudomonas sp. SJZ094]